MLWHDVQVDVDDASDEVREHLRCLVQRADQELHASASASLVVARTPGGHRVLDGGDLLVEARTPRQVLDATFARVHRRAFELAALAGWVRVHGAVVRVDGARLAVIGAAGAGKTTLALQVLASGGAVEGDESFVVRSGVVVAVPRRFHVKPGTAALVPAANDWIRRAPTLGGDPPLQLVDPTDEGLPWHLPVAPLDHVVLVVRGAGPSVLERASGERAVPLVLEQTFPTVERMATVVGEVAGLLRGVGVHRLHIGDDGRAIELLRVVAEVPSAQ